VSICWHLHPSSFIILARFLKRLNHIWQGSATCSPRVACGTRNFMRSVTIYELAVARREEGLLIYTKFFLNRISYGLKVCHISRSLYGVMIHSNLWDKLVSRLIDSVWFKNKLKFASCTVSGEPYLDHQVRCLRPKCPDSACSWSCRTHHFPFDLGGL
jgi:hypothetical protein